MGRGAFRTTLITGSIICLGAAMGCNQSDFGPDLPVPPDNTPDGPGDPAWGSSDVSCDTKDDCAPNEDCIDAVCQMPRCTDGPYDSLAPLGPEHYFFHDRELIAADSDLNSGKYWVDSYLPGGGTLTYPSGGGSYSIGTSKVVDLAGGNLLGTRPEEIVVAVENRKAVIVEGASPITLDLSFQPVAVATGDVDHDSLDEVIALGAAGQFAICHVDQQTCDGWSLPGSVTGKDVGAGDVDGDGYDEAVFFIREGGKAKLLAFNADYEDSGEDQLYGLVIDTDYMAMDVGDIDGDGKAEILALQDGGWLGFASDHVEIWHIDDTNRVASQSVDADSRDIAVSDVDMDRWDEMLVLHDGKTVEVFHGNGPGSLSSMYSADLNVTGNPSRIAAADTDGDTPAARRISDAPELIAGQPVPMMVLNFPPYSKTYSDGLPGLFVGSGESHSEEFTDSIGLTAGVTVGVSAEDPTGFFGAEVSASLRNHVETSRRQGRQKVVGMRFSIQPKPDVHGDQYGVVLMSSACYNLYRYQLDDPAGRVGRDGGEFVMVVPVGGQATVWSTNRYNALADALGTLPKVGQGMKLGDPTAYPAYPTDTDGTAVDPDEMLFEDTPNFLVSDVGGTGWWLSVADHIGRDVRMNTEVSVSSSIKVGGVKFGSEIGINWGKGYSLTVGTEALFGGMVPPIPDDPSTPEDEYQDNAFSFSPFVYSQPYTDSAGNETSYYELNFATGH